MTGFIMSKSSQQAPVAKPDPLAQYPERYSQADQDHQARYQRLKAAGHRVETWRHDPAGLRAYEEATKSNEPETDEQQLKRLAEKKKDIEHERDHGEMRPKPEQYDLAQRASAAKMKPREYVATWLEARGHKVPKNELGEIDHEEAKRMFDNLQQGQSKPEQYDESSQTEPPKISADRLADLKARSAATERRLQDAGLFGAGKGPPGLDPEFLRREKQRGETLRALKQDHPELYSDE